MTAIALQRRLRNVGVTVSIADPGVVSLPRVDNDNSFGVLYILSYIPFKVTINFLRVLMVDIFRGFGPKMQNLHPLTLAVCPVPFL